MPSLATLALAPCNNHPSGATAVPALHASKSPLDKRLVGFIVWNVAERLSALTGLGLKEAKEATEALPSTIKEGVDKETADEAKAALEEAGATVEVK